MARGGPGCGIMTRAADSAAPAGFVDLPIPAAPASDLPGAGGRTGTVR